MMAITGVSSVRSFVTMLMSCSVPIPGSTSIAPPPEHASSS